MKTREDILPFAALLEREQITGYISNHGTQHPDLCAAACKASVKMGKKFARVDVGTSGKYMVDLETGEIYGIKAYGVVHRGHYFGTLDTIQAWNWSDYRATPIAIAPTAAAIN